MKQHGVDSEVVNKRCAHDGCGAQPVFNMPGSKGGLFCKAHANPTMVDVVSPKCAHCRLFHVRKKGEAYWTCRAGTEKAKRKETEMAEALEAHADLRHYTLRDAAHGCATAKYRPDFAWEVRCELARLHALQGAFAKPLTVVRYNPDAPGRIEDLWDMLVEMEGEVKAGAGV